MRNLSLTQDQLEVLHDIVEDTVQHIECNLDDESELQTYHAYDILQKIKYIIGAN